MTPAKKQVNLPASVVVLFWHRMLTRPSISQLHSATNLAMHAHVARTFKIHQQIKR